MMTTNKLTKTFASGSLAIGVLAGAGIVSTPVNAAIFGCNDMVYFTTLFTGDEIICNTKRYFNFRDFSSMSSGGATTPALADIAAKVTNPSHGEYFIDFQSALWSVGPGQSVDTAFKYDVEALSGLISSVDQELVAADARNGGKLVILDTVTSPSDPSIFITLNTEIDSSMTPPVVMPKDQKSVIPPQKILTNSKDIALVGGLGEAAISDFRQSVHQTKVPEPGTILGLLTVGGLGLVSRLKRQK